MIVLLLLTVSFSHKTHYDVRGFEDKYKCSHCHQLDAANKLQPVVPGKDGHKPCSDSACHGPRLDAVKIESGEAICSVCHDNASKFGATAARLVLPAKDKFEFGYHFNHAKHLKMERFSTAPEPRRCDPCHKVERTSPADALEHQPDHADCHECHQPGKSSPQMTECEGCHEAGKPVPHAKPHGGIDTNYRVKDADRHPGDPLALFHHEKHRFDPRGARKTGGGTGWSKYDKGTAPTTGCGVCHNTAWQATTIDGMSLLPDCAMQKTCMRQCHDDDHASRGGDVCLPCHKPTPTIAPKSGC